MRFSHLLLAGSQPSLISKGWLSTLSGFVATRALLPPAKLCCSHSVGSQVAWCRPAGVEGLWVPSRVLGKQQYERLGVELECWKPDPC